GGMGLVPGRAPASGAGKPELLELLAQRAAVDAEDARGAALVALGVVEHYAKQRLLDLAQHQIIEIGGTVPAQAHEVVAQRTLGMPAQRQLAAVDPAEHRLASSRFFLCGHRRPPRENHPQAASAVPLTQCPKALSACANCAAVLAACSSSRRILAGS